MTTFLQTISDIAHALLAVSVVFALAIVLGYWIATATGKLGDGE